jgi:hypothetical protein
MMAKRDWNVAGFSVYWPKMGKSQGIKSAMPARASLAFVGALKVRRKLSNGVGYTHIAFSENTHKQDR